VVSQRVLIKIIPQNKRLENLSEMSVINADRRRIINKFKQYAPNLWWGDRFDVRFHLISILRKVSHKRILDIGCGIGIILSELSNETNWKVGLDISRESLKIARKIDRNADFVLGDMHFLPFLNEAFDYVIIANALSTYDFNIDPKMFKTSTPERQIKEAHRVLNNYGTLLLTTPNQKHKLYKNLRKICHEDLCKLLNPYFHFKIHGFNPIPMAFPERIIDQWIFGELYMKIVEMLVAIPSLKGIGKFFFVKAQHKLASNLTNKNPYMGIL
jgi:ubiquinone/menaquinone biosynthesis C-methylase UbiE